MLVIVIGCVIWLLMRSIDYIMNRIQERQVNDVSDEENHESRRLLTHISVARKVIMFIVVLIGIGIILSQFETLQNLGVSLLASAGLATVILGIAAQGTLGNIVAGMQIAITKPVRIGDTVMYEGNWGTIEEIRFTYLTVDTWDHRRVIVPLKYFISKPFENWSKNDPHLIKPIYLYLDYKANVQDIREKFEELLKADDDYDGEEPAEVLVTECAEEHIKLRFKCSAKTPTKAWELHCRIREQLAKYIGENKSDNLSRERIMFMNELETSGNSESSNSNTYSTYTHNGEKRISTDDNS
jgi:small-conductance mechanosensitive channel